MQPVTRTAVVLIFAALFAIISSWYAWINITTKLRSELKTIEYKFNQLTSDHKKFAALADEALAARSIINEHYQNLRQEIEKDLQSHQDYSACPVPSSLRLRLQYGSGPDSAPCPAESNPPARPQQH